MTKSDKSVTVVVRRRIHPELVDAYEDWLTGVIDAASAFEGHRGAQVLRPPDPATQDYVLLFRFQTPAQLAAWHSSETARGWLERGVAFTKGEGQVETITGLEFWFQVPTAGKGPPARHKMVVATVIGLYPLILFLVPVLADAFKALAHPVEVLLSTLLMVLLMTYAVMPLVTRGLSRWLFPR